MIWLLQLCFFRVEADFFFPPDFVFQTSFPVRYNFPVIYRWCDVLPTGILTHIILMIFREMMLLEDLI